jgi:2OG-Fe(II) oxygenase superfamily
MTSTARAKQSPRPADALTGRPWLVRDRPFPHYVAEDVFTAGFYTDLVRQFGELRGHGLAETMTPDKFSRMSGFDAYSLPLQCVLPGTPLSLFTSRPWHDLLARAAGVPGTGHVRAALHHHLPGSADGSVHNDFNPGYFETAAGPGEVVMPGDTFSYHSGADRDGRTGPNVVATVRALAVLIYLHNPSWRPGDGGETALYFHPRAAAAALAPPKDNSMLIFECTPMSFHRFCSNRGHPRNSIIMWLHRPWQDAVRRWGEKAIVRW